MLTLLEGNAQHQIGALRSAGMRFHLAYLDPPFFTGRVHRTKDGQHAFDDRWPSLDVYIGHIAAIAVCAYDLLTPDGSIVIHVDPSTSHHVKVRLDTVIGRERFASEIIWRYRRWPTRTTNFQRVHDVLLRYVKDTAVPPRFVQLYEPLADSTRATWGDRKQRAVAGPTGKRTRSSSTADASPGVPLGDVWDIGIVAPMAKERTGYPTQKPELLLERLISALTFPGDRVLDPMCGSGTALAVAARLGRDAVGIDSSPVAIRYARARLGLEEPKEAAC